jgi:hypothetical protein
MQGSPDNDNAENVPAASSEEPAAVDPVETVASEPVVEEPAQLAFAAESEVLEPAGDASEDAVPEWPAAPEPVPETAPDEAAAAEAFDAPALTEAAAEDGSAERWMRHPTARTDPHFSTRTSSRHQ